jgi:hypothetical protein
MLEELVAQFQLRGSQQTLAEAEQERQTALLLPEELEAEELLVAMDQAVALIQVAVEEQVTILAQMVMVALAVRAL